MTVTPEVCDFHRFARASSFMAFTGARAFGAALERRLGGQGLLMKTGNAHVRRVLVGPTWSYLYCPSVGINLRRRSEGQPPEVLAYA